MVSEKNPVKKTTPCERFIKFTFFKLIFLENTKKRGTCFCCNGGVCLLDGWMMNQPSKRELAKVEEKFKKKKIA